jgi:TP901 family phage tail tape measure protein
MAKKSNISTNIAIGANLSGLTRGLKVASSKMRRFGSQAKSLGTNLSRSISAPLIGLGAISVKTFSGFEAEMSKVKAVSGATADQFKRLESQAKELGATTTFTATEVAGLQTEFAKLGFTASEIDKVTESTLYLAQAGGAELGRAAEVAGATLRAFGLEAAETGRVTDVMAKSFATSSLDMESFAEAMKTAAPIAKATGVSMEETSAMLGALANNGIKGSIAGTALKKILSELHQEGKPMRQTFRELASQNINLAEANDLVGERAKGALMILTEQMSTVDGLTESYQNAQGAAAAMAEEMMDNTAGAFKTLQSATEGALIELGEAITNNEIFKNILQGLTRTMGKITEAIRGMSDAQLYNKTMLAGLLAMVPLVIAAVGSLTLAFGSLTAAMGPLGIALAGVTALYLALRKEVDKTQEAVDNAVLNPNHEEGLKQLEERRDVLKNTIAEQQKVMEDFADGYSNVFYDLAENPRYKAMEERLKSLRGELMKVAIGIAKIGDAQRDANKETEEGEKVVKKQTETLVTVTSTIDRLAKVNLTAASSLEAFGAKFVETGQSALQFTKTTSQGLKQAIDLSDGLALQFSQNLGNAIAGAIVHGESFSESFITALKAMAAQLIATIALVAVLAALLVIATGGLGGLSLQSLGVGMKAVAASSGIQIPFLAEGGIVTGPTLAMIGEGRESEAVIPLSKLPQIAGATGGAVEVYGRLSGQDILLSTEKANRTRSRYRGF